MVEMMVVVVVMVMMLMVVRLVVMSDRMCLMLVRLRYETAKSKCHAAPRIL